MKLYIILAHRYGLIESHKYIVGVYDNKDKAISIAKGEVVFRGGKYECEVLMHILNKDLKVNEGGEHVFCTGKLKYIN